MLSLLWVIWWGWLGAAAVNYLSDVLPRTRQLTRPACRTCEHTLPWMSLLYPSGCPGCGDRPSPRTWVVFLLLPLFSALIWYFPPPKLGYYGGMIWVVYFALVAVIDIEHRLILHPVSLVGAVLGAISGTVLHGFLPTLLGGAAGFAIMLVLYLLGVVFLKWVSRRRGEAVDEVALGFGDVNLGGINGLLLGWPGIIAGLFLAILIGGLISGLYLVYQLVRRRYRAFAALPYGPFLILSVLYLVYLFPYLN